MYKEKVKKKWDDFWDVKKFKGKSGMKDKGDREWWMKEIELMEEGVKREKIFKMEIDRE